jgi:hypothetical protein
MDLMKYKIIFTPFYAQLNALHICVGKLLLLFKNWIKANVKKI